MPLTRRLLQRGFAIAVVATALVCAAAFYTIEQVRVNHRWVVHTQQVLEALEKALTTAVAADEEVRTYLVTGEHPQLSALAQADAQLQRDVDQIQALTSDNPGQRRLAADLRLRAQELLIALHASASGHVPPTEPRADSAALGALRSTIRSMRSEEQRLLRERVEADERATQLIQVTGFAVALAAALLLAWVYILLTREARGREQFVIQLARTNEELERRVEERTRAKDQALREAEAASRLKDEFLMTISHELRTPLTAIYGWARMLATGQIREERRPRALAVIEQNARALSQLVNDLLDVSRVISGKLRLNVRPADLGAIVRVAVDSLHPAAEAKDITVELDIDQQAASRVSGDPERLQQVVWNLLSNAFKFTGRGGRVTVRVAAVQDQVEITVSDTGQGISPEFLPFVFDRFRQADAGPTRQHGGLGLGLAIARHLVELHGGSLSAESEGQDRGATFRVRLPAMPADQGGQTAADQPAGVLVPIGGRRIEGVRILAVDDEPYARELFATMLPTAGAEVRTAASAAEAMQALADWTPDVLLSDLEMPDEDGYSLVRKALALDRTRGGRMMTVAVSAHARREDRLRALEAGFRWHMPKPIEPSELIAVIASLMERQRLA